MRTVILSALCCLASLFASAQHRSPEPPGTAIYHDGWIDFNKNGIKDIFEDPAQPVERRQPPVSDPEPRCGVDCRGGRDRGSLGDCADPRLSANRGGGCARGAVLKAAFGDKAKLMPEPGSASEEPKPPCC